MYRLWQETHRQFRRLCGHRHRGRQSGKESGGNFGKPLEITGRKAKGIEVRWHYASLSAGYFASM